MFRISPEGVETLLLADTPQHGLKLCRITCASGGIVRVLSGEEATASGAKYNEYAVENGKLRAVLQKSSSQYGFFSEEACREAQSQLDERGVGVGVSRMRLPC